MAGNNETRSVLQTHTGRGDNYAGDHIDFSGSQLYLGLMPDELKGIVRLVLDHIANYRLDDARKILAGPQTISFGPQDSNDLISVLTSLCDVVEHRDGHTDGQELRRIVREAGSSDLADLALSIILRLQVRSGDVSGAAERFRSASRYGAYSRAIYFEWLCEEQELQAVYAAEKFALTPHELGALAGGLLRFSNGQLASEVASFILAENAGNYNGKVLMVLARAWEINARITSQCYWLLKQADKDAVLKLINDTLSVAGMTDGRDRRLYNIILPVFDYVQADHDALEEFCLTHIEMIDSLNSEFADRLRLFSGCKPGKSSEVAGGERDVLPDCDVQMSEEDFFLHFQLGHFEKLREWTSRGGRVRRDAGTLTDAVFCVIECVFSKQSRADKLKNAVETLSDHQDIRELNPYLMRVLAKEMMGTNHPYEAAMLLDILFRDATDVWCSPLVDTLCEALYAASQYRRLGGIAGIVSPSERTPLFYHLTVDSCFRHQNPEDARVLIDEGLALYPESISLQFSRLVYLNQSGDHKALREAISTFDLTFLETPSEHNFAAMHFLREHGRREDIQDILVRWFVSDPDRHARIVSQFCLNTLTGNTRPPLQIRQASGNCLCGVAFEVNGEVTTRIISSLPETSHSVLLPAHSPLATKLLEMLPGETSILGMRKIRLLEKIPAYVAVFRLSAQLRNEAFDGKDVFCSLSLPHAAEDIPAFLLDHLPQPEFDHELLGNSSLPLSLRAYRYQPGDPVNACVQALTDQRFLKASMYDTGLERSDTFFTDLITLIYLSLTSLSDYFVQKKLTLYVSPYTLRLVDEWIDGVETGEYRKLGLTADRRISILNAEAVMNDRSGIFRNLKSLRTVITAVKPVTGDLPWTFSLLREALHPVSFAEYYAISAGTSPYITIDAFSAAYVRVSCGDVVCNTRNILIEAASTLPYADRESGIALHIYSAMPLPLILSDVENLSSSPRFAGPEALCRFLAILTPTLPGEVNVYDFLVSVYLRYVQKVAHEHVRLSCVNPFLTAEACPFSAGLDRVMYACCGYLLRTGGAGSSEEKLIALTCTFLSHCDDTDLFVRKFWPYIQLFMQGRFMSSAVVVEGVNSIWRDVQRRLRESNHVDLAAPQ
ncbi:MAG: hypothetical protein FT726_04985 [Pantoea sp. Morm]|uniref:hypothetical protein n=1 Tax=Pantoea sp. Morm TaxID=2601250 RepID=UPI001DCA4718|nr:hypothetical protein [Pantoea sp. Morm]